MRHVSLLSLLLLLLPSLASAQTVIRVAWDPVSPGDAQSGSAIGGYLLYQGTTSHQYTTTTDVGNVLITPAIGLAQPSTTYYFAVVAYNVSGQRTDFSTEVGFTTPPAQPPTDTTAPDVAVQVRRNGNSSNYDVTALTTATDVVQAQVYLDTVLKATLTAAPYAVKLAMGRGTHTVRADLRDAAGNLGTASATVVR